MLYILSLQVLHWLGELAAELCERLIEDQKEVSPALSQTSNMMTVVLSHVGLEF